MPYAGSSATEPVLFHTGCRSQHLYLTMGGTNPSTMLEWHNTYIWPWEEPILPPCQKGTTLTSNHGRNQSSHHVKKEQHLHLTMGGTNPLAMSKRHKTYIWPWKEPILSPCHKGFALTYNHGRNQSYNHVRRAQHLHPTTEGPTFHHGGKALRLINSPWREPRSREHQASPWSTQTSLWPFLA